MDLEDYRSHYWMKSELIDFARRLGLPIHGYKPELSQRIERRLRGLPDQTNPKRKKSKVRDSDRPLRRDTLVLNYFSDAKTRAFFKSAIGSEFHFTYHLNQYRLARTGLRYGDLIDEWVAEQARRRSPGHTAPIAEHGKWNHFVRDFFADTRNKGKSLSDAARAWKKVKAGRGKHRYHS